VLVADSVRFGFADALVLQGASLRVAAGEMVALLGPNGAGKSTLIRCISGRLRPALGTVRIAGHDPYRVARARVMLGLVPQSIALYGHLDVIENIACFARLAGLARSGVRAAVDEVVARCELDRVARQRASTLSGGWQRRVNIACAIAHRPRLLVLDEATVGIDPPARRRIEALVTRLAADGLAILMTGHDLEQLEHLVDRVAFLDRGRVVADDAPSALLKHRFGDRREVDVHLAAPADDKAAAGLAALEMTPVDAGRRVWHGLLEAPAAARLPAGLPAGVDDLRVRRPGLDSVWRALYGEPPRGGGA